MASTIQAIVCTVDLSPFSPMVIGHGVALARRTGMRLYLFHAVNDPQDGAHPTAVFERGGDLTHLMDDANRRIQELMADSQVEWEAVVRFGEPVEQTITFVNDLPPCLVISASHGVSGFRRIFIGTVVERLTRALDHPMLVVKTTPDDGGDGCNGFRSAVISCDSHGYWRRLIPLLAMLQTDCTPRIHLVHAMEGPMDKTLVDPEAASYSEVQQTLQDRLVQLYHKQAQQLFPRTHRLSVVVAPGVPEEMTLRIAREQASDMIVVGVRRSGRVERLISGSTTETLLRRAPCCVLAVPEPVKSEPFVGDPR